MIVIFCSYKIGAFIKIEMERRSVFEQLCFLENGISLSELKELTKRKGDPNFEIKYENGAYKHYVSYIGPLNYHTTGISIEYDPETKKIINWIPNAYNCGC